MRQKMQKTSVAVQKDQTQQSRSVSSSSDGDDITKKPTFRYEQRSIGEPTFCNPCSFANCTHVFRKFGCDAGIIRFGERNDAGL